jgi:hypothetical protein
MLFIGISCMDLYFLEIQASTDIYLHKKFSGLLTRLISWSQSRAAGPRQTAASHRPQEGLTKKWS